MNNLKQREYYKIFSSSNKTVEPDKLHLGYQSTTVEIIFKKDNTTFFHIPFFATPIPISQSSLIGDGAVPGPIPAMADRIQQKQAGNYDNTPWGVPVGNYDGTWLCSWLYSLSGEAPQWLDRYYNPGKLLISSALQAGFNSGEYIKNDPPYIDVPSTLILTPGTYFQYFHNGEKTAKELLNTFSGEKTNPNKLCLSLQNWNNTIKDESIYNNIGYIKNFNPDWVFKYISPDIIDREALNFNNNDFIDARVVYNSSYNLENEFTLSFWVYNDNWSNVSSTQLVGNYNNGGFGVFTDNLKTYPFFVVPETFYGHIFYYSPQGVNFLDKSTQPLTLNNPLSAGSSIPARVDINGENEVVVLDSGIANTLYKVDHTGTIIARGRLAEGGALTLQGESKLLAIDQNNNYTVVTTSGTYLLNNELILTNYDPNTPYRYNEQMTYDLSGNLIREIKCTDIIFDQYNKKWTINDSGILYQNTVMLSSTIQSTKATNLIIDPENNLWVLHDSNKITKINTTTATVLATYEVGIFHETENISKNIDFINEYNRELNTQTWYALIYHDYEKTLYRATLNGELVESKFLPENLNIQQAPPSQQLKEFLQFRGRGDFTGYKWKRIFNNINYNNKTQLHFKLSIKQNKKNYPTIDFKASTPIDFLSNKTWHLITCTLKNKVATIYIDAQERIKKAIPGNFLLNYLRKNDLYIGTPAGKFNNLNTEIGTNSLIFNGYIDDIRIYNYSIEPKFLTIFVREKFLGQDMIWNIPTAPLQYVEGIERFFKHKLPGNKSQFFKIKLSGLQVNNPTARKIVESSIFTAVNRIKPGYAELLSIDWVD